MGADRIGKIARGQVRVMLFRHARVAMAKPSSPGSTVPMAQQLARIGVKVGDPHRRGSE